jgi:hypothetical protein
MSYVATEGRNLLLVLIPTKFFRPSLGEAKWGQKKVNATTQGCLTQIATDLIPASDGPIDSRRWRRLSFCFISLSCEGLNGKRYLRAI